MGRFGQSEGDDDRREILAMGGATSFVSLNKNLILVNYTINRQF